MGDTYVQTNSHLLKSTNQALKTSKTRQSLRTENIHLQVRKQSLTGYLLTLSIKP